MYPHRIRLRDPWKHDAGRSSRRFGYPGCIDAFERVWLTLQGVVGQTQVILNGTALGQNEGDFEFEITPLLRSRNELILEAASVRFAAVGMEVRAAAFLRCVHAELQGPEVVATGEVVGHADGVLDLYLILDRSPSGYATVAATETGTAFRLSSKIENLANESPRVAKIELVQGAVTWFTLELDLHANAAQGPSA